MCVCVCVYIYIYIYKHNLELNKPQGLIRHKKRPKSN